ILVGDPVMANPCGQYRRGRYRPPASIRAGAGPMPASPAGSAPWRSPEQLAGLLGPEDDAGQSSADQPVLERERNRIEGIVEERCMHHGDLQHDRQGDGTPEPPVGEQVTERARTIRPGVEAVEELCEHKCGE